MQRSSRPLVSVDPISGRAAVTPFKTAVATFALAACALAGPARADLAAQHAPTTPRVCSTTCATVVSLFLGSAADAQCRQDCFDDYIDDLRSCSSQCMKCVEWVLFFCVVSVMDDGCFHACARQAKRDWRDCVSTCSG